MSKMTKKLVLVVGFIFLLSFLVMGCGGGGGAVVVPDPDPDPVAPVIPDSTIITSAIVKDIAALSATELAELAIVQEILDVTIGSPPVVTFALATAKGEALLGGGAVFADEPRFVRFTLAKLVPGTTSDSWVSYLDGSYDSGRTEGSSMVDNGDGTYTYTFGTDITAVEGITYDPTLTHRLGGQVGRGVIDDELIFYYDFVPDGSDLTLTRNIAVMESCNECHDNLTFHGDRNKVEYCVTCHNPSLTEGDGDFSLMIHRIHQAGYFPTLNHGRPADFSEVTYPQDVTNCMKCHTAEDAITTEGDNWKNKPNEQACIGCHYVDAVGDPGVNSESITMHTGVYPDLDCTACHSAAKVASYHLTGNATPNNPDLPTGVPEMGYEIIEVTADAGGNATVVFSVTVDGVAQDLNDMPAGFYDADGDLFRVPGFLPVWALAQDGIDEPTEYSNEGSGNASGSQPASVNIDAQAVVCVAGECTTILPAVFPAGATLRGIGLQGYFRYDVDGNGSYDESLHTPSVVMNVTGDDAREMKVDNDKCFSCHEWFEGHGGNRVYDIAICATCHNPNLSSGGRAIDLADAFDDAFDEDGVLIADPVDYPESSNNLKDMVHGIHASGVRENAFQFVRGGSHGGFYDWSEVTFPTDNSVKNCANCHTGDISLPSADSLPTTVETLSAVAVPVQADIVAARASLPNTTDIVNSPVASSCVYCHDTDPAIAHMNLNGGVIEGLRSDFAPGEEACAVCHGDGKDWDINVVHAE